jgi:hypothetical protein
VNFQSVGPRRDQRSAISLTPMSRIASIDKRSTKDEVWRMAETKLYASCVNRWHARLGEHAWSDHQCLGGRTVGPDFVPGNPGTLL